MEKPVVVRNGRFEYLQVLYWPVFCLAADWMQPGGTFRNSEIFGLTVTFCVFVMLTHALTIRTQRLILLPGRLRYRTLLSHWDIAKEQIAEIRIRKGTIRDEVILETRCPDRICTCPLSLFRAAAMHDGFGGIPEDVLAPLRNNGGEETKRIEPPQTPERIARTRKVRKLAWLCAGVTLLAVLIKPDGVPGFAAVTQPFLLLTKCRWTPRPKTT